MDLSKCCIINAAYGRWYPTGTKRLVNSLNFHGCACDILTWVNEPINEHFNPDNPYTIKAAAFIEAANRGYTHILWLDCSVWAVKSMNSFFDLINDEGLYMYTSGYNLAQTATDSDLRFAGFNRNEAEKMHECASNMVGLNLNNPRTRSLFDIFIKANEAGVCSTSRNHDNQSKDSRFLFGRQDQTAFSIAFHKAGYKNEDMKPAGLYSDYHIDHKEYPESITFLMRGI